MIEPQNKKSVCIATPDIVGPIRNGGIGTACFEIAKLWRSAGHEVTVLYVNQAGYMEAADLAWKKVYDDLGIKFVICPEDFRHGLTATLQRTWNAWQWLRQRDFDAIYFPEWGAVGLYAIQAKRAGLDFAKTAMMVGTHSPTNWHSSGGMVFPNSVEEILVDAAERQCVAECDLVVSPSAYMVDYLRGQGWRLPADVRVIPNPFPGSDLPISSERRAVTEIVFFGRLEQRKGLGVFLRALNSLPEEIAAGLKVTFLGKPGQMPGGALKYIETNRRAAFAEWKVIDTLNSGQALEYLSAPGRLAIMASLTENSPMTVRECLALGIPFLASSVGGIPELVVPEMHEELLFEPRPSSLRAHILRSIENGVRPGRGAIDELSVTKAWLATLEAETDVSIAETTPTVSVVVTTFNRPDLLDEALDGLRKQRWKNLEVVLVDDGSTSAAAQAKLDSLESEFSANGWKIIRQENAYLGAARNAGWRAATGELVIFHDDDNYSSADLVKTYVRALAVSGADIATCSMAPFVGIRPQGASGDSPRVFGFVGDAVGAGMITNAFGDAHACFTRAALEKIGGFTEDYGIGHEDWEIFARATLMGLRIQYVPKPLFWYRESPQSMLRSRAAPDPDFARSLRPYCQAIPGAMRPALEYLAYLSLHKSVFDQMEAFAAKSEASPYSAKLQNDLAQISKEYQLSEKRSGFLDEAIVAKLIGEARKIRSGDLRGRILEGLIDGASPISGTFFFQPNDDSILCLILKACAELIAARKFDLVLPIAEKLIIENNLNISVVEVFVSADVAQNSGFNALALFDKIPELSLATEALAIAFFDALVLHGRYHEVFVHAFEVSKIQRYSFAITYITDALNTILRTDALLRDALRDLAVDSQWLSPMEMILSAFS